jgi:hypothetical protein
VASAALARYARGLPLALILILRLVVVAFRIGAGLARLPRAVVTMAKASLMASAATDVLVYANRFPDTRPPGDATIVLAISFASYAIWLLYLVRSKRVRNTFA